MIGRYDKDVVQRAAVGKWRQILPSIGNVPSDSLVSHEIPCPMCGGNTRWRTYPDFSETGGCRCNQCGNWPSGFDFIAFKLGVSVADAIDTVGQHLNCQQRESRRNRTAASSRKAPKRNSATADQEAESGLPSPTQNERNAIRQQLERVTSQRKAAMQSDEDFLQYDEEIKRLKDDLCSLRWLSESLGVSVHSLESLAVSYNLKDGCWESPERDAQQNILCVNRRYEDGSKKARKGGKRGLIYSSDWQSKPGPVLIVEGLSDTAAGITLNLPTIGKPSAKLPKTLLPELVGMLKTLPSNRQIVVLGDNDLDSSSGRWPGRDGATETATALRKELGRPVEWGMPPEDAKDLRSWLNANPGLPGSAFVESMELKLIGDCRGPASEIDPPEVAEAFLQAKFKRDSVLTFHSYRGSWWRWQGPKWEKAPNEEIRAELASYLGGHFVHVTRNRIADVLEFVLANTLIPSTVNMPSWLDCRAGYSISFENGIVLLDDLIQGRRECLRPHSPQWFSEVSLPYEFHPDARCPLWTDMLFTNLEGDVQREMVLQEFAGYCLTHSTEHHAMLFLTGDGGNGKSCVLAGLTAMLGRQNVSSLSLDDMGEKFKRPRMVGKLANICADLSETNRACEGVLKKLISGDPLEWEEKHKASFTAVPTAKLIFATNSLPRFFDRSGGLWRRLKVMPFERKVTDAERITGMDSADWWLSKGELPGIFNWALRGLQRLLEQAGFSHSEKCQTATEEHRKECNTAKTWLEEEYKVADNQDSKISKQEVYRDYERYCHDSGISPLGMPQFMRELKKVFPAVKEERPRENGTRQRYLKGIAVWNEAKKAEPASIF